MYTMFTKKADSKKKGDCAGEYESIAAQHLFLLPLFVYAVYM